MTTAHKLKDKSYQILFWFVFACINIYILHHFFFPLRFFYFLDDWFVLPEKVWFDSNIRWLGHLLFFNQNRFTWTGDFMLYRPGLFLVNWVTDVLFRSDRILQQFVVIFVDLLSLFCVYTFLRKFVDIVVALTVCLYILCLPVDSLMFLWPHLASYLLAVGFYFLGLKYYFEGSDSKKNLLITTVLFTAATTFHEFAVLSLAGFLLIQLMPWKKTGRKLKLALLLPLVCYTFMVLIVYGLSDVPAVFSNEEASTFAFNDLFFSRLENGLWTLVSHTLALILPFGDITNPDVQWYQLIIATGVLGFGLWLLATKEREKSAAALPLIISIVVIIAGVLFGRVVPHDDIPPPYYILLMFFTIPLVILCYSTAIKKNNYIKYSFVVIVTLSNYNFIVSDIHDPQQEYIVSKQINLIGNIKKSIKDDDHECFAGIVSTIVDKETSYLLNISLLDLACKTKEKEKSSIFIVQQPDLTILDKVQFVGGNKRSISYEKMNTQESFEIYPLLMEYDKNIAQVNQQLQKQGSISIKNVIDNSEDSDGLSFKINSNDEFPILYNFGFKIYSAESPPIYLIFQNNYLFVENTDISIKSSLPLISSSFEINLVREYGNIFIMIDDNIILQSPVAFDNNSKIDFFNFENGTSGETLSGAYVFKSAHQVNAESGNLQFFQRKD